MTKSHQKTLHCRLISPEQTVLDGHAWFVVLPAHDGQVGVAVDHAPLICKLGIGPLRIDTIEGHRCYFIDGGFARVRNNELVILASTAVPADQIDPAVAQEQLDRARAMPLADPARRDCLLRAKTQLDLVRAEADQTGRAARTN